MRPRGCSWGKTPRQARDSRVRRRVPLAPLLLAPLLANIMNCEYLCTRDARACVCLCRGRAMCVWFCVFLAVPPAAVASPLPALGSSGSCFRSANFVELFCLSSQRNAQPMGLAAIRSICADGGASTTPPHTHTGARGSHSLLT